MNKKTSIAGKYDIKDVEARKAVNEIQKNIPDNNIKHFQNEIKTGEASKISAGRFYTDIKNDNSDQKRIVTNIGGKLYFVNLSPVE